VEGLEGAFEHDEVHLLEPRESVVLERLDSARRVSAAEGREAMPGNEGVGAGGEPTDDVGRQREGGWFGRVRHDSLLAEANQVSSS
jgi:hypothetical protein